jgi:hypothetical protein
MRQGEGGTCPKTGALFRVLCSVDAGIQDNMPSAQTLFFRLTRNQSGNFNPLLLTVHLNCIFQLAVFICYPGTRTSILPVDAGIQDLMPSTIALFSCATRNQCDYYTPILATVRLYSILQLAVFIFCSFTRAFIRSVDAGIQGGMPSTLTLTFRSTRNHRCNYTPILATVRLYSILQLAVFVFCPFTRAFIRPVDAGIQDSMPSATTLCSRSTRNQSSNCAPILATVPLNRILQLAVFVFCPFTRAFIRPVDAGIQDSMPSATTLYSRSTRNQSSNCAPILATVPLNRILQVAVFVFYPCTCTSISHLVDTGIQGRTPSL